MSIKTVFDSTAATYNSARRALIPCFDQLYATALSLIPADADHILDLGAGTGLLSTLVRERLPGAHLHLIDSAPMMLQQAQRRFAQDQEIVCQLDDYTCCEWGSSYDAIVSALSIHHLSDADKRDLFSRIFFALKPGGVFINAEQILAPTLTLETEAREIWLTEAKRLGATEQQIAESLLRQEEDRCATIDDQLLWLRQAGFKDACCPFQSGRFAVLTAVRRTQVSSPRSLTT